MKTLYPKNVLWMNLDTGELVSYSEMLHQCETEYDFDDFTNMLEIFEYFEPVEN